jgi:L-fuculose-phosphate aldolase
MLLHEGRGGQHHFAGDRFDTWYATHVVSHPFEMMLALLGLIVEGVFQRHPRLRVGILESGTGWLPWWLHRIDEHHELFGPSERADLELMPSGYFAKHCFIASDSDDDFVAGTVRAVGADHVAWSSDFPHLEAKWPDGAQVFAAESGLTTEQLDDVLWRTPCRLYGMDPDAIVASPQAPRPAIPTTEATAMQATPSALTERQQMAVACRTLALQGYDDKLAGHVSVRDREDGTLLVPRVGVFWDEICPNDFVRIDRDGNVVEGEGNLNPTIVFHLELHKARPDIRCALHNHPPYGTAWACAAALPPLYDQTGANGGGKAVVYSEYEGVVETSDAAASLARAYGDADLAILTGHGTLVTASSVALALLRAICFEHRARKAYEVQALGLPGKPLRPEFEASASAHADGYAVMLMGHYARRLAARDPLALVDDLSAVPVS